MNIFEMEIKSIKEDWKGMNPVSKIGFCLVAVSVTCVVLAFLYTIISLFIYLITNENYFTITFLSVVIMFFLGIFMLKIGDVL